MSCPDPYRPDDPLAEATTPSAELKVQNLVPSDVEVRGLATALAASGGGVSSKDLALDLVLNQIVEQACLATGATGAAIALTRDGEMVCRATTGRNAPDLGVRLDNAGFSAECLRVGTLQRCDDTETDPRVDAMACRLLGVRSILVIPLWYWGEFMGIFEIFSPRPNAFGERDEQTLQALAYRIVRQAKQAAGPITGFTASSEIPPPPDPAPSSIPSPAPTPIRVPDAEPARAAKTTTVFELTPAKPTHEPADLWTMVLAGCAILIACAIVGLMIWRVSWSGDEEKKAAAAPETVHASTAQAPVSDAASAPHEEILELNPSEAPPKASMKSTADTPGGVVISASKKSDTGFPASSPVGLAVYDKGKLIYGTPIFDPDSPGAPKATAKPQPAPSKPGLVAKATPPLPSATDAGKSRFVQLSPAAADDLLTTRIEPEYPDAARRARVQGSVTMDMLIGADGKVMQVSPIGGSSQLADAAIAAVQQWRYKPYVVKGKKVPVHTQATVSFMLPQ
jgi:TonB family protein